MVLQLILDGAEFTVYAIMQGESVLEYLARLESVNAQAHAQIARRLEQIASRGPSKKKDEFRDLGHDLYEAKAKTGPRVIFFYDKNWIVICSHAFDKQGKKTPRKEIKKAMRNRRDYFYHKAARKITINKAEDEPIPRRQP